VLILKDSPLAQESIVTDEVIGIVGKTSMKGDMVVMNELIRPDLPLRKGMAPTDSWASVAFMSDIHIGSNTFLQKPWERMIDWMRKEGQDEVRYLVVPGDVVDGIGIFPGQEEELEIDDIFAQYEALANHLKDIPDGIRIIMQPGNHDAVRPAEPQPTFPRAPEIACGYDRNADRYDDVTRYNREAAERLVSVAQYRADHDEPSADAGVDGDDQQAGRVLDAFDTSVKERRTIDRPQLGRGNHGRTGDRRARVHDRCRPLDVEHRRERLVRIDEATGLVDETTSAVAETGHDDLGAGAQTQIDRAEELRGEPQVEECAQRRQHDYRDRHLGGTQRAQHGEAVHAGDHAIEDDAIVSRVGREEQAVAAVFGAIDGVILLLQPARDVIGEARVVFDQEYPARHFPSVVAMSPPRVLPAATGNSCMAQAGPVGKRGRWRRPDGGSDEIRLTRSTRARMPGMPGGTAMKRGCHSGANLSL
jgi:hypothetical protein